MSRTQSIALTATVAIVAIVAGMLLSRVVLQRIDSPAQAALASGTLLHPPRPLPDFAFVDQDGQAVQRRSAARPLEPDVLWLHELPGRLPDDARAAGTGRKELADLPAPQRPQVILVSVDPRARHAERLATYVQHFSPSFRRRDRRASGDRGVRATDGRARRHQPLDDGNYTVDHSAAVFAGRSARRAARAVLAAAFRTRRARRRLPPHRDCGGS